MFYGKTMCVNIKHNTPYEDSTLAVEHFRGVFLRQKFEVSNYQRK